MSHSYKRGARLRVTQRAMSTPSLVRRLVLAAPILTLGNAAKAASAAPAIDTEGAHAFVARWDAAWAAHDAQAIAALHSEDAITVNRFGTVVSGRTALQGALGFLHGPDGPFHRSTFPRQRLLALRGIAPGVMVLQTAWRNPVMRPDGTLDPTSVNDMIVTFVLVRRGVEWLATEVNLVNVEKMDLPFSSPGQKP